MARSYSSKEPSQRQRRVNELLRHALAEILVRGEINDADLAGSVITVTEVQASPDLKNARIYVTPLGGRNQDTVLAALKRHQKYLRGEVARKISLKYMPALIFVLDTQFDNTERLDTLLRSSRVAQDLNRDTD